MKSFRELCGFDDRWMILIGIPTAGVMVSIMLFYDSYRAADWKALLLCVPVSIVYTTAFWMSMRYTYHLVRLRYPALEQIRTRIIWMSVIMLALFVIINAVLDSFFSFLFPAKQNSPDLLIEFLATVLLSVMVMAIYEAMSYYLQLQQIIAEKTDLERRHIQSQLDGLRNQVNPHFLFNSLNTLTYLIPEDSAKAVRFVQQLSKVYRYVLESRDAKLIPLREEMEFMESYIFLLKERFGDKLQIHFKDLSSCRNGGIVPLSLQLLFENAIKHNIISAEKPLHIEVFQRLTDTGETALVVRNPLQRKNQVMDSTGVGLENIRSRYHILSKREISVIATKDWFTVELPLLNCEN
jgi:two-component system, LytTR family, sensor kinase